MWKHTASALSKESDQWLQNFSVTYPSTLGLNKREYIYREACLDLGPTDNLDLTFNFILREEKHTSSAALLDWFKWNSRDKKPKNKMQSKMQEQNIWNSKAWALFSRPRRSQLKIDKPDLTPGESTKELWKMWHAQSQNEKDKFLAKVALNRAAEFPTKSYLALEEIIPRIENMYRVLSKARLQDLTCKVDMETDLSLYRDPDKRLHDPKASILLEALLPNEELSLFQNSKSRLISWILEQDGYVVATFSDLQFEKKFECTLCGLKSKSIVTLGAELSVDYMKMPSELENNDYNIEEADNQIIENNDDY